MGTVIKLLIRREYVAPSTPKRGIKIQRKTRFRLTVAMADRLGMWGSPQLSKITVGTGVRTFKKRNRESNLSTGATAEASALSPSQRVRSASANNQMTVTAERPRKNEAPKENKTVR